MRERGVTVEDVAQAWLHSEKDRPSPDHPGFRVRTARVPDGREITVVARETVDEFRVKTVWVG